MFVVLVLLSLRYYWATVNNDRVQYSKGLVLVPAGPGIVRRVGMFRRLPEHEIADAVKQEITIV